MISWGTTRSVAVALAGRNERRPDDGFDYATATGNALAPLSEFTGIELAGDPAGERRIVVSDRAEWIDFNIDGFGILMEPILERAARGAGDVTKIFGGATLTAQMGFLLGFLSARVLGQYDTGPLMPHARAERPGGSETPQERGKVFFLDGNIVAAAERLGVPVDGLRLWIVLHEMTHALQFEGYPWIRDHLGSLMEALIGPVAERIGATETIRRLTTNLRTGGRSVELFMTAEQRLAFDRVQATMSVIEGYSDYVMDAVGRKTVPGYKNLTSKMARSRANRPPLDTAIFRLTGMDVKLEQYKLGERFCSAVAARQGMDGLNRVWDGPENLPTLTEVRDPGLWMLRMERDGLAAGA